MIADARIKKDVRVRSAGKRGQYMVGELGRRLNHAKEGQGGSRISGRRSGSVEEKVMEVGSSFNEALMSAVLEVAPTLIAANESLSRKGSCVRS